MRWLPTLSPMHLPDPCGHLRSCQVTTLNPHDLIPQFPPHLNILSQRIALPSWNPDSKARDSRITPRLLCLPDFSSPTEHYILSIVLPSPSPYTACPLSFSLLRAFFPCLQHLWPSSTVTKSHLLKPRSVFMILLFKLFKCAPLLNGHIRKQFSSAPYPQGLNTYW